MEINLRELIAPPFYPVHRAIRDKTHDEFWLKGGRNSTKSSFCPIEIVLGMMKDPSANALCLRKTGETLRTSVQESILWAIDKLGVSDYWDSKTNPAEVTYKLTGQKIIFRGLDKPSKLKSIRLKVGYFKYLWFEELEEFSSMEEVRNVEQSVLRGGDEFVEFLSFNPPNDTHHWVNQEVLHETPNKYVHHSTYLEVPPEWIGKKALQKAEQLKAKDHDKYRHEYLGEVVGRSDKIVFSGKWRVEEIITPHDAIFYYGMDFGFANDPTVVLRAWVDEVKREIYVDYCFDAVKLEIDDHHSLLDKIPESTKFKIRADNARPETISFIKRQGFNVVGCQKWKGSIEDGVEWLRSYTIVVHPRCHLLQKNLRLYSYKVDKDKEVTPRLEDAHNDAIDALRYALEPFIKATDYTEPEASDAYDMDLTGYSVMG